jgi:hypothetical protein
MREKKYVTHEEEKVPHGIPGNIGNTEKVELFICLYFFLLEICLDFYL